LYLDSFKPLALRIGSGLSLPRVLGHDPRTALTTVLYHRFFAPGEDRNAGRDRLRRQLDWLRSRYTPLSPTDAVARLTQGTLPEFPLLVTVDDAKVELLDVQHEFAEFGVPLTVGVVAGWAENEEPAGAAASLARVVDFLEWYRGEPRKVALRAGESFWLGSGDRADAVDWAIECARADSTFAQRAWDVLAKIDGREPGRLTCTWSELRDLQRSGTVMASHTVTHCRLAAQSQLRLRFELGESKRLIEERLGEIDCFVYPYGRPEVVSPTTTDVVEQTGYKYAFLTHAGLAIPGDSLFHLPRIVIPDHIELDEFRALVAGAQIPVDAVRRRLAQFRGRASASARPLDAEVVCNPDGLATLAERWAELRAGAPDRTVSQREYERLVCDPLFSSKMLLVVVRDGAQVVTLAPFVVDPGSKKYTLGQRKLGTLPVRWLRLVGESFLGDVSIATVRRVFDALSTCGGFDLVTLGEIAMDGALYRAVQSALTGSTWRIESPYRQPSEHWVIDLPESFEAYMANFNRKTRQNRKRELRLFAENHAGRIQCIKTPDEVESFLKIGEQISRRTYQWNVGQRLVNDEATRERYKRDAADGVLRCYLAFAGDEPCAFARGTIRDQVFHYETPGYDPRFAKASPGSVLLLKVIEDLITDSDCKVFDFGTGGDLVGYKSVYGTRSYKADLVEIGRRFRPYTAVLFGVQDALLAARRVGHAVLGDSELTQAIKRRLRKYGEA
jgi:peptidoglycan/xylan/chitin deacetylase (PgdA/CDA1 family)